MNLIAQYLEELQGNPLSNNFEVRPSPIHGNGVFSQNRVKKGDFINTHMTPGTTITKFGKYLNHSDDPNAQSIKNSDGSYMSHAQKDIKPGDEITLDYTVNQELEQPQEDWN